jgi:hypothetical protein
VNKTLRTELEQLLNRHCQEKVSYTPDFILASFMMACLSAFEGSVVERDRWYGYEPWADMEVPLDNPW